MLEILKTAFFESRLYRTIVMLEKAYEASCLKMFLDGIDRVWAASACHGALERFARKKPAYKDSLYKKTLDNMSGIISNIAVKLNEILKSMVSGSRLCGFYSDNITNEAENCLRGAGIFGFYFFLTATALSVFGNSGRGALCFGVAIAFLALALSVNRLSAIVKGSWIAKLLLELVK